MRGLDQCHCQSGTNRAQRGNLSQRGGEKNERGGISLILSVGGSQKNLAIGNLVFVLFDMSAAQRKVNQL
jgi:hypothetical protein